MVTKKTSLPSARSFPLSLLIEYKDFLFSLLKRLPLIIWGTFAVIGILVVGMLIGMAMEEQIQQDEESMVRISRENTALWRLIDKYDELSHLYYLQGENVRVIMDPDVYEKHPSQTYEAIASLEQFQNMIMDKQKEIEDARSAAWERGNE